MENDLEKKKSPDYKAISVADATIDAQRVNRFSAKVKGRFKLRSDGALSSDPQLPGNRHDVAKAPARGIISLVSRRGH